jgi:arabinofuranosyltransferase
MTPTPAISHSWLLRLAAVLLVLAGLMHAKAYWVFQPDDAFIFLVYAKNLLAGNGLTFNGELVEGYSSMLWTLLVSAVAWPGIDLMLAAKMLGNALYFATAMMLMFIAYRLSDTPRRLDWRRLCLLAMFFSSPLIALWASAAMEAILLAFLLLLACYLYFYASMISPRPLHYVCAGLAFGMLAWTRPEGFAFLGAVIAFEISKFAMNRTIASFKPLLTILTATALFLALLAWRYFTYGELLPTTVSAKTGNLIVQIRHGLGYFTRFLFDYYPIVIAYITSTFVLLRRGGQIAWWAWLSLIFVAGYSLFSILVGGDWMLAYRFIMPMLPIMFLAIFLAIRPNRAACIIVTGILVVSGIHASLALNKAAAIQAGSDVGDIFMGQYIHDLNLPKGSKIAVIDAGAIPYFSGLATIDMIGLNNVHISKLPGGFMEKWDNDYVLSQKPVVIQLHAFVKDGVVYPSEVFQGTMRLFYSAEFQQWYEHDTNSPVPHLFKRRSSPLTHTFMDSFHDAELKSSYNATSRQLAIDLRKTGDGIWPAQSENRIQGGALYVRVRSIAESGAVQFERYVPLQQPMKKRDAVNLNVDLPNIDNKYINVCLVLMGVAEFPQCDIIREAPNPISGTITFTDSRLTYSGWSTPEATHIWSVGELSSIVFKVETPTALKGHLSMQVASFGSQRVTIKLNGSIVFTGQLNGDQMIHVAQATYQEGENLLEISTPDARSPGGSDTRVLGIALKHLAVQ